tara:strand:+ start:358 stop:528 length:171 start_codon:yes stop_codon:yes gene_type:complete
MYFIIWKPKDKFTSFTNQLYLTEKAAREAARKCINRKIEWDVIPFNKENSNKYWYK